tara:strand:+ start:2358 stop:2813 length:456 start_codon:yes stop_codon:yes gene_type:complete
MNRSINIKKLVNCKSCKYYDNLIITKEKEYKKIDIHKVLKKLDILKIKHCKEFCNTCLKLLDSSGFENKEELQSDSKFKMDDIEKIIDDSWEKMEEDEERRIEYSKLLADTKRKNPEYFKIKKYCKKNNCDINEIINRMNNMKISKKKIRK